MEDAVLKHAGCGGRLTVNLQSIFLFVSPSISVNSGGVSVGPIELRTRDKGMGIGFICAKCQEEIDHASIGKKAVGHCFVCREDKPLEQMRTANQFPSICESCVSFLTEEKKNPPDKIKSVLPYLNLKDSGLKFLKFADILKKPVTF